MMDRVLLEVPKDVLAAIDSLPFAPTIDDLGYQLHLEG